MYGLPKQLKTLSAAEETVMFAVWKARAPITRSEIAKHLPDKTWVDATVLNFLYRLAEKGWVKCHKEGNRNVYIPLITHRAYSVYTMRERLESVFSGDVQALLAALLSETNPSREHLEAAKAVIDEKIAGFEEYDWYEGY